MRRNAEERVLEGDLKPEVSQFSSLLPEAQFHHNVYSERVQQGVDELDRESERLGCDTSFALTSSEPLGMCLTFSNSQIKHL